MLYFISRAFIVILALGVACGCTAWQPTKEVWKTTKGLWYDYVSPPASVDYDDKGDAPPEGVALSHAVMGIDMELTKLERVMQNADKPPTQEWLSSLFASFPWLNGFAGVKYDGTILGQEPPDSLKQLDFIPLLYEDAKQGSRASRADAQPGPLGPEIILATPLYDGVDFLGIVAAYFDMRSLMRFSQNANDIVVLTPGALLWPGKYDFAATPLAGVDWNKVVRESVSGTCSNSTGSFYYMVRFLGNLPMVFAIPASGTFPEGNGSLEQGNAFFPQEREKLPPPPMPERKPASDARIPAFEKPAEPEPEPAPQPQQAPPMPEASDKNVIRQGSKDSMLLRKQQQQKRRQLLERQLEGINVEYTPVRKPPKDNRPALDLIPDTDTPKLRGGRPSPFGPRPTPGAESSQTTPQTEGAGNESTPANQQEARGPASQAQAPNAGNQPQPAQTGAQAAPMADGEKGSASSNAAEEEARAAAPKEQAQPAAGESTPTAPKEEAKPAPKPATAPAPQTSGQPPMADGETGSASSHAAEDEAKAAAPKKPATLPGGRPSPFGPRN